MILNRIEIKNFRSIKNATIYFDEHCRILLGKNEAGKSNVLKAIAALFGSYKVSSKDKRKKIENERITEYYVRAVFRLSDEELAELVSRFSKEHILSFNDHLGLEDFSKAAFRDFLLCINIADNSVPYYSYWTFEDQRFEPSDGSISIEDGLVAMMKYATDLYEENPYVCHFWQYSDNYLLPSSVKIADFIAKPSSCKGLRNLFILCDRENIKKEFEEAIAQDGDYINLLNQISAKVTSDFRSIWPDFKDTTIHLMPNGTEISIKVSNKAHYSFADRSDGFKHFVSILLMLSAPSKKGQIGERDIILIDEPDTSLYPSSARYLRDELFRISENSYVVYATHSQYMIDPARISRHLIVEKNNDITTLNLPNENAQYSEDELLLNAIGTSIFECIRPNNIVFEGWLDKKLFESFIEQDKALKKLFKDYGRVYLHGISGAISLCQLLILAGKNFIVVSDSDEASKNKRRDFVNIYPEYRNNWKGYADVVPSISTVEDFLKPEYVESFIKAKFNEAFIFDTSKNVINNIQRITKEKERIQQIKVALITDANIDDIKVDDYKAFIEAIIK